MHSGETISLTGTPSGTSTSSSVCPVHRGWDENRGSTDGLLGVTSWVGSPKEGLYARRTSATTLQFGFLLLMALATAVPAAAQLSTATVQGIVTDATGVMPGVTVTARETDSGFSRDTDH